MSNLVSYFTLYVTLSVSESKVLRNIFGLRDERGIWT